MRMHVVSYMCIIGSCTGPRGQACVDRVPSTHSSLAGSERNPHRWLSTFKKVGCVRHVNWGLISFCSFLWHCTIQAIFVYSSPKNKNTEAEWHLKTCFLMSTQTTEQEPALVIHQHKLLALTWHVFSATDDELVCSANTENGPCLNQKCGIEQSGETPHKIN